MKNKKPFPIKDGKLRLARRLHLFPSTGNFLETLEARTIEKLPTLLAGLLLQIAQWKKEEPEHFLVKDIKTDIKGKRSELSGLEDFIRATQKLIEAEDYKGLAFNMYSIGETVGRLNHVEGWLKELVSTVNMSGGSPAGGKITKKKADARKALVRDFALGYFKGHPTNSNTDAAVAAQRASDLIVKTAALTYTVGTLAKILTGCREKALLSLRPQ
jgi:hypothetical protein